MMRNEVLHGYLIHHRKYREKSHIVHLFTQEYGRVDGILRQTPPPQYQPIRLQATGKSELKNFTKLEILNQPVFFHGDAFFAGFYLNEIVLRLCPLEEAMHMLQNKFAKKPAIVKANIKALTDGYNYGHNTHATVSTYRIESTTVEPAYYTG